MFGKQKLSYHAEKFLSKKVIFGNNFLPGTTLLLQINFLCKCIFFLQKGNFYSVSRASAVSSAF